MACIRLGLFKAHYLRVSLGGIATHRNIYFVPYQIKKITQREVGVEGGIVRAYRESTKGASEDPQRQHKVILKESVLFLFIYLPCSVSSYILFGGLSLHQLGELG